MTVVAHPKLAWDTREYGCIRSATFDNGALAITFEDETVATVAVERLTSRVGDADWHRLTFTPYEVVVSPESDQVEIWWFRIRTLTDPAFAAHLSQKAAEQRVWYGERIRSLRIARGGSTADLTERLGISADHLNRIETGDPTIPFPSVVDLAEALGYTSDDLVEDESTVQDG